MANGDIFPPLTNTAMERLALSARINLSDGHARAPLSVAQSEILDRAAFLFRAAADQPQQELERAFSTAFFGACHQRTATTLQTDLSYSASVATVLAARALKQAHKDVMVVEPCFDNIIHLLRAEGLALTPLPEDSLRDESTLQKIIPRGIGIWIVMPNNPTGFAMQRDSFEALAAIAAARQCTLVLDFCFRFYCEQMYRWDQYAILEQQKCSYIAIEDTGKTWPLLDTKASVSVASQNLSALVTRLHQEVLLNVSPWHLQLLTEFIRLSAGTGLPGAVKELCEKNRAAVRQLLHFSSVVAASEQSTNTPFEFFRLENSRPAEWLWHRLRDAGIDILPAHNYFWSGYQPENSCFRVPLSRPHDQIVQFVHAASQVLSDEMAAHGRP